MSKSTLVFIHGYSVTSFDTYGELPLRLRNEAKSRGEDLATEDIFLGRYISFNDEVLLQDVAKALEKAVSEQLPEDQPFIAVTHSTGGPLVRTWWKLFYQDQQRKCPMTHLIMLAPANHGSALAQLGKSKLSRVKTWVEGLEPGQGILNWLELGSNAAWDLNCDWIKNGTEAMRKTGVYPFVITGQNIDRKLYDHINSYTGEDGSDGVVRLASASLNSAYVKLEQEEPSLTNKKQTAPLLKQTEFVLAPASPFKVIQGKSHSGDEMGIMRSVKKGIGTDNSDELIFSFFECLDVDDDLKWNRVQKEFEAVTIKNQKTFEVEEDKSLLRNRTYLHDRYSQVIIRVRDQEGQAVTDFDLVMTGDEDQPDLLPNGFFKDRQCNLSHRNILTFYLNYDVLNGCEEKRSSGGEVVRPALKGCARLGFKIIPRPSAGFVRYLPCSIAGGKEFFNQLLRPNSTTLIEIVLQRILSTENFRFEKLEGEESLTLNYKNIKPGEEIV